MAEGGEVVGGEVVGGEVVGGEVVGGEVVGGEVVGGEVVGGEVVGGEVVGGEVVGGEVVIPIHKPDSKEKMFFLLSGIIVSIPITVSISIFSNSLCFLLPVFYSEICTVAIFAPFVEEFSKAFPLFYRHGETQRSIVTLGFLVGLGFGISEFILYVFGLGAPVIVRLPGVFFHASSASITAYGIATNRAFPFYLIAAALHFSYNFSTFLGWFWLIGGPAVLIITYFLSWHFYHTSGNKIVS